MREIRMLRAMWRELETGPRWALLGHEGGTPRIRTRVHPDGQPRQLSTLPLYCTRNRQGNFKVGYRTGEVTTSA